jgi:DNA-binding LacI/PurR family transcriptional regulator
VVCGDPFDQMHTSTKYLLSLGLKKIGFVTGSDASIGQHMSTMGQYGYERALLEARLEFVERRIHIVGESFMGTSEPSNIEAVASIRQGFAAWLRRNEDLEGVVCGNDLQAAMIIRAAEELGRRVPEGLSVTGAGNLLPYFRQVVQSLTTLDVQIDAFGGKILELFDEMEAGVKFAPGYRRTVKANLVVGTTTRKPGATSRK